MSERKGQERMREKRARKGAKVERLRVKRKRKWEREREICERKGAKDLFNFNDRALLE